MHLPVHPLLTPAEVAALFGVAVKTVTRWADSGKLASIRTPGGHRRFHRDEIRRLQAQDQSTDVTGPDL